jgi:uncharacterized membrane protein YsdA (DUF1294 family)
MSTIESVPLILLILLAMLGLASFIMYALYTITIVDYEKDIWKITSLVLLLIAYVIILFGAVAHLDKVDRYILKIEHENTTLKQELTNYNYKGE